MKIAEVLALRLLRLHHSKKSKLSNESIFCLLQDNSLKSSHFTEHSRYSQHVNLYNMRNTKSKQTTHQPNKPLWSQKRTHNKLCYKLSKKWVNTVHHAVRKPRKHKSILNGPRKTLHRAKCLVVAKVLENDDRGHVRVYYFIYAKSQIDLCADKWLA